MIKNFYAQHAAAIKRSVVRKLGSVEDAEDITQDAFHNLLTVDDDKLKDNPAAYAHKVAHNLALNRIRKNTYHTSYLSQTTETTDERSPERSAIAQRDIERIIQSLNTLPVKQISAFKMSRFENRSYDEISVELKISVSGVEKLISKTMKHLRYHFDDIANG